MMVYRLFFDDVGFLNRVIYRVFCVFITWVERMGVGGEYTILNRCLYAQLFIQSLVG